MIKKSIIVSIAVIVILLPIMLLFSELSAATSTETLKTSWNNYKSTYIRPDGSVRRLDQGNDVVSEGVAYAMLRAVWMDDQSTFDKVYSWTEKNLSRKNNSQYNDHLLAWWFKDSVVDWGAASDADLDYALALVFAAKTWTNPTVSGVSSYRDKAIAVQKDILRLETGWVGDSVYLQPGTWYAFKAPITVNPSYLSPAHYKIFNQFSPDPRWDKLVNTAYEVAWKSSNQIPGVKNVGLPADWVIVQGDHSVTSSPNLGIDYKYDAFRTNFRIALDYIWFNENRAKQYLTSSGARNLFLSEWNTKKKITGEYSHAGQALSTYDNAGTYGANIGWFIPENKDVVSQFTGKMQEEFNKNNGKFFPTANYYMENWAFFGYALGTNNLPNLYAGAATQTITTPAPSPTLPVAPTVVPTPTPQPTITVTPQPSTATTQPNATPATTTQGTVQILSPVQDQKLSGVFTLQVKNTVPNSYGTWWSVDGGGWNMMNKTSDPTVAKTDIDISSWTWNKDNWYILHAWSKDASEKVYHHQIIIRK